MILTVTLNTALDITYRVPALRPHSSHRVTEVTERPGGKGLNVARVLAALGHEVTVTGFTGGATGRIVQEQLAAVPGLVDALVPVAATRPGARSPWWTNAPATPPSSTRRARR